MSHPRYRPGTFGNPGRWHDRVTKSLVADGCITAKFSLWLKGFGIRSRLRPDAFRVNYDHCTLDIYEVEHASKMSRAKLAEYRSIAERMDLWSVRVYRIFKSGWRRVIDTDPGCHYDDGKVTL